MCIRDSFCAQPVGKKESSGQHDGAHEKNVIARHAVLGVNHAEKRLRQRVASSHSEKQARRTKLCSHSGTKVGQQERQPDHGEQRFPRTSRNPNIRRIDVRKMLRCWPDQLRDIYFDRREKSDHYASQHRSQQNIPPRVFRLFGKR